MGRKIFQLWFADRFEERLLHPAPAQPFIHRTHLLMWPHQPIDVSVWCIWTAQVIFHVMNRTAREVGLRNLHNWMETGKTAFRSFAKFRMTNLWRGWTDNWRTVVYPWWVCIHTFLLNNDIILMALSDNTLHSADQWIWEGLIRRQS